MWRRNRDRVEAIDSVPALRMIIDLSPALRVNVQLDPVICERKDRSIDRSSGYRVGLQPRQNPHAAPTPGGLFEQNLSLTNHKYVFFDEPRCTRGRFPDRQRFRTFCEAEFSYRTNAALRLSRNANKCAEIDQCGVVDPAVGFRKKTRCTFPEQFPVRCRFDQSAKIDKSRQNASSVSFDDWD